MMMKTTTGPSTRRLQSRRGHKHRRAASSFVLTLVLTSLALIGFVVMALLAQNNAIAPHGNENNNAMNRWKQSFGSMTSSIRMNSSPGNNQSVPSNADIQTTNLNENNKNEIQPPAPPQAQEQEEEQPGSPSSKIAQLMSAPLPSTIKIHKLTVTDDAKLDQCPHTVVTGYFRLRSKYPAQNYLNWMQNMLSLQDCMVIFSSSDAIQDIQKFRHHAPTKTIILQLELDDLPLAQMGADFWQHQLDIDPEKRIHRSYQLFYIWLSKSWFVMKAIEQNYFHSKDDDNHNNNDNGIFMWQDIGAFRNRRYNGKLMIQHPEVIPPHSLLWLAHHPTNPPPQPIWNDKYEHKEFYFHSGSQGAGRAPTWREYHRHFTRSLEQFLAAGLFIGEDQCVLQSTCQQFPALCAYVPQAQVPDNHYFGLRHVLHHGGQYRIWRFPNTGNDAGAVNRTTRRL